jgi:hypothetical protein
MEGKVTEESLIVARKKAERAVEGMEDGPLKVAAFQTILSKLLTNADAVAPSRRKSADPARAARPEKRPGTLRGRVLGTRSEGFFKMQRGLGEVRDGLRSKGFHYPLSTLSGLMQGLVRERELRRERVTVEGKQLWKYSNP